MELKTLKLRRRVIGFLAVAALASGALLWAQSPTARPTTQAVAATPPVAAPRTESRENWRGRDRHGYRDRERDKDRNMPIQAADAGDPYAVLKTRSIFVKGNQAITARGSSSGSAQPTGALVKKPEASLVFNGVTVIDHQANAFIEDLTADHVSTVRVGDGIAGGKVSAITFDTLSYEANGHVLNVMLGQNLEGNVAAATGTDATPSDGTNPSPAPAFAPGYIGVGANSTSTAGLSPQDILARMKAKRQAELIGK